MSPHSVQRLNARSPFRWANVPGVVYPSEAKPALSEFDRLYASGEFYNREEAAALMNLSKKQVSRVFADVAIKACASVSSPNVLRFLFPKVYVDVIVHHRLTNRKKYASMAKINARSSAR